MNNLTISGSQEKFSLKRVTSHDEVRTQPPASRSSVSALASQKRSEANNLIAQIEKFSDQQITTMFKSMVGFELTPYYRSEKASPSQKALYTLEIEYNNHDTISISIPAVGITPFQTGQMEFLRKIHDFIKPLSTGEDIQFFKNIEFKESLGTIEISSAKNKLATLIDKRDEDLAFNRSHNKSTLQKVLDCTLS